MSSDLSLVSLSFVEVLRAASIVHNWEKLTGRLKFFQGKSEIFVVLLIQIPSEEGPLAAKDKHMSLQHPSLQRRHVLPTTLVAPLN